MPRKTFTHDKKAGQLDIPGDTSQRRELFLERKVYVSLKVELVNDEAWEKFHALPKHVLPILPARYKWIREEDNYFIMRETNSENRELKLVLYGPDTTHQYINFIFLVDGVTWYSFSHTKKASGPDRHYPDGMDFRVPGYDYDAKKYSSHVKGHLIDHKDTMCVGPREYWSTYDSRNYVPEPPEYEWGLGFRRLKVAELSKRGGAYAQFNVYEEDCLETEDGTPVPVDVRFIAYTLPTYQKDEAFHVEFEENMTRPKGRKVLEHANSTMRTSLSSSPFSLVYQPKVDDRALRLQVRNTRKQEAETLTDHDARYPERDRLYHAYDAADLSFESIDPISHAGVLTYGNDQNGALKYMQIATRSYESLLGSGSRKALSEVGEREVVKFFNDHSDKDDEVDALQDHFSKLMKDAR